MARPTTASTVANLIRKPLRGRARNWATMSWVDEFTPEQKKWIIIYLRARERWFDYVDLNRQHVRATRPPEQFGPLPGNL